VAQGRSIFCLKKTGEICWVATASKRCVAASSTDTGLRLISLGASVRLVSTQGERTWPSPISTERRHRLLDAPPGRNSHRGEAARARRVEEQLLKLRRRGAFDFPVLGVAAAVRARARRLRG